MEEYQGRILMKQDEVDVVQLACQLQVSVMHKSSTTYVQKLESKKLGQAKHHRAIPMVPRRLTVTEFANISSVKKAVEEDEVPISHQN